MLFVFAFCFNAFAQEAPSTVGEKEAIYTIAHLPEVAQFNKQMLKNNGKPLIITVDSNPTAGHSYYTVAVVEDRRDRLFTYWRFCINAKTHTISYWDVIADKRIPLKTWRKYGRKP